MSQHKWQDKFQHKCPSKIYTGPLLELIHDSTVITYLSAILGAQGKDRQEVQEVEEEEAEEV